MIRIDKDSNFTRKGGEYGDEWRAYLMKLPKAEIIEILRELCVALQKLEAVSGTTTRSQNVK